jgi:SNF2 family DNA or RNA helicase
MNVLLPHQADGVRFLVDHARCLLLDEPGLGKTIQALAAMDELRRRGELERVLVATDSTMLAKQWVGEAAVWLPGVLVAEANEKDAYQRFQQAEGPAVFVATYDLIRSRRDWMGRWPWSLVVLDEVSVLKGGKADHGAAREMSRLAERCVGLTATPLENDGCDTWAVLDAVGTPDLWAKSTFDKEFIVWGEGYSIPNSWKKVPPKPIGLIPEALPRLRAYLAQHTMTRSPSSAGLRLPIRVGPDVRYVQPTPAQTKALTAAGRLRDLARHQARQSASSHAEGTSAKAVAATEWIVDNPQHSKVLVYAENLEHLDIAGRLLDSRDIGHVRIEGKITPKKRRELLEQFETDPDVRVLLGSSVLERGLNLQSASALLSLGCSWNPAREAQREGRVCRIGSRHATYEHLTFMLDHGHDRDKWVELERKRGAADSIKSA